ncbi:hypothetical protein QYE76_067764 [Lolium multiflorum]|uniref:Arabidopsis retrotransposon Orf1 C-terminal domain-containing protein n=1 Tax=Lolium multiflorum TaxID=4521 RepID=A0AAD8SDY7_LOLMU|nr:hypothetical protein QYE76_067764 [Lolium multiflorum]
MFFYVKNTGAADLINLPAFNPAPSTKVSWGYFPGTNHIETNRVVRFMEKLMKETNICSEDIIRTFISRRVLPLKRRAHKISEMYGPGDPTKITGLPLSKADVVLKAKQICQTDMPDDWEWGFLPLSSTNPPTDEAKDRFPRIESDRRGPCRKRPLDKVDPDPYVHWTDLKMGRILIRPKHKLVSPPHASHAGTSARSENSSQNFDDSSAVLDNDGSLGSFLDATIARKRTPDDAEELLARIGRNHDDWATPEPTPTPILKKRGMLKLNDEDMREAKKFLKEKGIKSEDVKNLPPIEDSCKITPPSSMIEDPLYPEGHPKRVGQDSQQTETSASSKKKKKKHKTFVESSEPVNDPHSISISDAETESGNEHDKDNDKDDSDKEEVEEEPEKHAKNKKAVIDCNKGKVTFNVDDKEHLYFPKRIEKACGVNTISNKREMDNFNFGEVFQGEATSSRRPSRTATRFRQSYNEDLIAPSFEPEEDHEVPNASSFPCYDILSNAGLLDDFLTLVGKAGLTTYMGDESEQYYMLTKIFVESFKFNNKHYHPTVAFKIYGKPITMKLEDFCAALDIAPVGTAKKIEDNPKELLELYRGITNDDCRTIQRGKIRNIQLPAIKYFAYYIATSIFGRENTSNISSYHLAFLIAALTGDTPYHLGALVARRLSNKGPIFGGIIASHILAYLELPLDPTDMKLTPVRLDIAAMKSHQFVTTDSSLDNIVYRILFADGEEREILLPQPDLFSIDRKPWSRSKEEVDEQLKIQGFHQQHDSEDAEPSYDYTVTYPGASSSTYPEYDPSSSYYGGATSWAPWG